MQYPLSREPPKRGHCVPVCGTLMLLKTIVLTLLLLAGARAARQPFSTQDFWLWRTAGDARIQPDGALVVYSESRNDRPRNLVFTNLWLADTSGRQLRQLTQGDWQDTSPRWSPDGTRVAFLSTRGGQPEIWVRPVKNGEDREVTRAGPVPLALAWSPDGKSIAFTARIAPASPPPTWTPEEILPLLWPRPVGPAQVFLVDAEGGAATRVSSAELDFQGEPAWMPDGLSVLCAAGGQIFSIRASDHAVRELTREDSLNEQPLPSPDGSKIAFIGRSARAQSYAVRKLFVMNADGSRIRALAGTLGRDVRDPQWSSDSRTVYFIADESGATHVYAARNDGTTRQVTTRAERLRGFSLAANGRAAAVRSSETEGGAVISFAVDLPAGVATLASPNEHLLADREMGPVEEIRYPSAGKQIQAWLIKPPQFEASRQYPLMLEIQDAPRMFGSEVGLEARVFAAAGYVVLCANPRGTAGYDEEFGNLLPTAFPRDTAEDLLRGVEFVAAKGFVRQDKIAAIGGVTAAWLVGHSRRFTTAVLRRAWMRPMPWETPEAYVRRSPLSFADTLQTPALVIAGADDFESADLYFALQQKKVPAAMVKLKGDGPADRVAELQAALAWLAR